MRISVASVLLVLPLSTALAQVPPRPPEARRPVETPRPARPVIAPRPMDWPTPEAFFEYEWHTPLPALAPLTSMAPLAPLTPLVPLAPFPAIAPDFEWHEGWEQQRWQRELDREMMQQQREQARLEGELAREQARLENEVIREQSRLQNQQVREQGRLEAQVAREMARMDHLSTTSHGGWPGVSYHSQSDPADSLYRQGHELLRRGEYRRAAAIFRDLPTKFPGSAYQADALYWQAFALYRIGGTPELRSALDALEQHRTKYPGARNRADAAALTTRINGALSMRGDATATASLRNVADSAMRCDAEEQEVRAAALNALSQSDPDGAMPLLQRTLNRKDECTERLRRTAVFLAGNKRRDASTVALLAGVARTDPSYEVRAAALEWLARTPSDDALVVLEELARDASDERMQRTAVRALVVNPSARARQYIRGIVERPETPERLRLEAVSAFDKERSTAEDAAWLRALYSRTDNDRLKSSIIQTLSNIGGQEMDQWMLTLARNPDESSDTRRYALRRVARTLPIADLARLYDTAAERPLRESLIEALASRPEGEATDKLIDIVKTGTDPRLRNQAINALTRKKDPRSTRLLMEIIDK